MQASNEQSIGLPEAGPPNRQREMKGKKLDSFEAQQNLYWIKCLGIPTKGCSWKKKYLIVLGWSCFKLPIHPRLHKKPRWVVSSCAAGSCRDAATCFMVFRSPTLESSTADRAGTLTRLCKPWQEMIAVRKASPAMENHEPIQLESSHKGRSSFCVEGSPEQSS